jgi:hypothetical protein
VLPRPKLGRWAAELEELLAGDAAKPSREQLTVIRVFEELRGRGYEGGYDAVRRYARRWAKDRGQATAAVYVPLSFTSSITVKSICSPLGPDISADSTQIQLWGIAR